MDDRIFKDAMGSFATGVTVITTELDSEVHGMTANAFLSVSLNPKLIAISIAEKAHMHEKLKRSRHFAVNILSDRQQELSMIFAGQMKEKKEIEFKRLGNIPVLNGALAQIVCEVVNVHREGDHSIFIGKVIEIQLHEGSPLLYYKGKYL